MAQPQPQRLPMSPENLDSLRQLCRDEAAFEQLKRFLDERETLYQQYSAQIAEQQQKTQALEAQQRAAEAASQAKSWFLAMMSHELRTPLNSILGLSSVLSQQVIGTLNAKQLEYLTYIHDSGEHLLALISDILDLSKIEAGQESLRLGPVALAPLCQSCIAMVKPRAEAKGLSITWRVEADADVCVADERRLRQMLLNLLSNAIKFTNVGHVALTVQRQGAVVQLAVEDTGIGIPADKRQLLFQPFTQLDGELNRRYEGSGLGLALTQQLAQLHGGYLRVESQENQGSRFLLHLPLEAQRGLDPDASAAPMTTAPTGLTPDLRSRSQAPGPPPGQDIVLIDPGLEFYQPLVAYVQTCGWCIYPQRRWADTHDYLQTTPPHLLIVGHGAARRPTLIQHLQRIRQHPATQRVKVVVVEDTTPLDVHALGADACLKLPLAIPKLERILSL